MLFCACRAADVLNAIVGLWLVPKYVDPSELGAVVPLTNFANFLAIPVAAFANTFRNELTSLAINKEFGKLKTLIRGVFAATAIFLFLAIVVARFILPAFLERIRIVEGSLGLIIIASSFVGAISPIYSNAIQALKKFKAQSLLSIVSAPIRLIAMLSAMPFRALTGYFVGQTASPVFGIAASVIALRKELSAKAKPYWTREVAIRFAKLFTVFLTIGGVGGFFVLVESTIIRQRLSDLDSAGYYMATRFAEIATFLSATLSFTIFPFTAEKAAKGEDTRPLIVKSMLVNAVFCLMLAIPFLFCGEAILSFLPHGNMYSEYWWAIPWLIFLIYLTSIAGIYTTSEFSANHFGFIKWYLPIDLAYPIMLLLITGHHYFEGYIPATWNNFLDVHNIYSLTTMLYWATGIHLLKALFCILAISRNHARTHL